MTDPIPIIDDLDEKLYGLVEITEQQQLVAQQVLEQLLVERTELSHERQRWAQDMASMRLKVEEVLTEAASAAASKLAESYSAAFTDLSGPAAEHFSSAARSAAEADHALRRVVDFVGARLVMRCLSALAAILLLGWLASGLVLWWDTKAIAAAQVRKQQLQSEVAELGANRDAWINAGMAARLRRCGRSNKPCIPVDEAAGTFGRNGELRIIAAQ